MSDRNDRSAGSVEANHVKDVCKQLRSPIYVNQLYDAGKEHFDPLRTEAANLIEALYLAALPCLTGDPAQPTRKTIYAAAKEGNLEYWRASARQRSSFDAWVAGGCEGDCPQECDGSIVDYITNAVHAALAAQPPAAPVDGEKAARDYEHGYNDGVEWAQTHGRRPQCSAATTHDLSCAADFLDDIEVDENGKCEWTAVANAQTHIRAALRCWSATEPQAAQVQKDELLAFFLAFFDGWTPGTQLTVNDMDALERGRAKVAAMSSPLTRPERGTNPSAPDASAPAQRLPE